MLLVDPAHWYKTVRVSARTVLVETICAMGFECVFPGRFCFGSFLRCRECAHLSRQGALVLRMV